jgi:predicted nucleic acid-binding protein
MKIAVDASVIVCGVHANHPRHALAAAWLLRAISEHSLLVSHHTILEVYAVLTRLPADFRVTPSEARDLLMATVKKNMRVVPFSAESIWKVVDFFVVSSVAGGRSYDAFVAEVVRNAGAEAIATFNPAHFRDLTQMKVIDPSQVPQ